MIPNLRLIALIALAVHGATVHGAGDDSDPTSAGPRLGGDTTVNATDSGAFSQPAANMPLTSRGDFFTGNAFFEQPWVTAPASTAGRDGLGPLFNLNACQGCHTSDGRGRAPRTGKPMNIALVRISIPADEPTPAQREARKHAGAFPEPNYGTQIQPFAINGLRGEPSPMIEWQTVTGQYGDGTAYELRRPVLSFETATGQPELADNVQTSIRTAPPMIGMGLLESIPAESIRAAADPDDRDGDGISGRPNEVWHVESRSIRLGRFGWKANAPTIREQTAAAFHADMGLTTPVRPSAPCQAGQQACLDAPSGGDPEVAGHIFDVVVSYAMRLAVPAQRDHDEPQIQHGQRLFERARCSACHTPTQHTSTQARFDELANQRIHPYTDLLLHDMGPGLADGRPDFEANGQEWRTAPLWGIGLTGTVNENVNYLHDGRARTLAEAILWHGGEAGTASKAFRNMSAAEREALLAFLESL